MRHSLLEVGTEYMQKTLTSMKFPSQAVSSFDAEIKVSPKLAILGVNTHSHCRIRVQSLSRLGHMKRLH